MFEFLPPVPGVTVLQASQIDDMLTISKLPSISTVSANDVFRIAGIILVIVSGCRILKISVMDAEIWP